jgi:hypothetical protein
MFTIARYVVPGMQTVPGVQTVPGMQTDIQNIYTLTLA